MSSGEQQLQADFAQIKTLLNDYRSIKLVATKGEPPEQYDIEYNIKGFKANPDGTVLPANKHVVRITLPFGYPHFPPTARPLTSIFHPDIDPDAIRIADFWKDTKSLPKLIIHIGRMICGTSYSADEPFNQRAFDWFEERKSWMPFDVLESHEDEEDEAFTLGRSPAAVAVAATATKTPEPAGEELQSEQQEEEISLDFDLEDKPAHMGGQGDETTDINNLLERELSLAFDPDEQENEFSEQYDATDDLTMLPEGDNSPPFEFDSPSITGGTVDLAGLRDETAPLSFGLELEPEQPTTEIHFDDLVVAKDDDFASAFHMEEEPAVAPDEAIDLGDLSDFGEQDLAEHLPLAAESTELAGPSRATAYDPPSDNSFPVDFGIAGESPPAKEQHGRTQAEADDFLGEFALQLDEDQGGKNGGQGRSIRPLIEQKEIFTAKRVLADIADTSSVPNHEELELTIAAAINEAEELYRKADKLEQKGELAKAGLLLDLVANITVDYPGLDIARNRIRESLMAGAEAKTELGSGGKRGTTHPVQPIRPSPKLSVRIPFKQLAIILAISTIAGGSSMLYFKDRGSLSLASTEYSSGQLLTEKMDFKEADKAFKTAQAELDKIILLRGSKNKLGQKIESIVNAQPFKEGLQGKVLYNDQYITVESAKAIDHFNLHTASADNALQEGTIDQAIASYEKSLEFVEAAGFQDKTQAIRQQISTLRFQQTLVLARKAEEDQEWKLAADTYQKALELSGTLAKPEEQSDIAQHLAGASLRHELDESNRAFTASDWAKTVAMLQRAQKIIADNPTIVSEQEKLEISKLLINSRVYQILSNAKKAFEQQDWNQAVKEYNNAIKSLQENGETLGGEKITDSISKIEKTILLTQIAQEQKKTGGAAASSAQEVALEHFRTIAALIEKSTLKDDAILREIYENSKVKIVALNKEISVNKKIEYLKKQYEPIFRENYPSAKSSELLNPQVSFVKKEGNIMIFAMSCVERNQGRSFRLELNYQYDMDKDSWSLYSGKL